MSDEMNLHDRYFIGWLDKRTRQPRKFVTREPSPVPGRYVNS
jgi:hypothetical protein